MKIGPFRFRRPRGLVLERRRTFRRSLRLLSEERPNTDRCRLLFRIDRVRRRFHRRAKLREQERSRRLCIRLYRRLQAWHRPLHRRRDRRPFVRRKNRRVFIFCRKSAMTSSRSSPIQQRRAQRRSRYVITRNG